MSILQPIDILDIRPSWENVSSIPTTPFQQSMLAVTYVVASIAFVTYCLRMYSKISTNTLGTEDWFMTAAAAFAVALDCSTYMYLKYNYAGFASSNVPSSYDTEPALFWTFIVGLLYNPTLALVKSSVLYFMLRIAGHKTEVFWSCHIINAINIGLMISTFLVVLFQTSPVAAYWDKTLTIEHSINAGSFSISTAILTVITDILVLAIPIYTFIGLKTNIVTKVGVIFIFLTSGAVTIIGIIRIISFNRLFFSTDESFDFQNTWGPTYSTIEPNVAIIAASVPSLTPLLRKYLPRLFPNSSAKKSTIGEDHNILSGGTQSIQLHDTIKGRSRAEVRGGHSPDAGDSQEEIISSDHIVKTTQVDVSYDQETMSGRDSSEIVGSHRPQTSESRKFP